MASNKASARSSTSRRRRKAASKRQSAADLTVTLPQLLQQGSDIQFRNFVADLFAAVAGMHSLRRTLAASVGLNAAEYSILLATWHLQKNGVVGIGHIAKHLHVAAANVTSGVGKLVRKKLLLKKPNPRDSRAVAVELTPAGQDVLTRLTPVLRRVNDRLFSGNKQADIRIVSKFVQHLAEESAHSIRLARTFAAR
jgi:MarR family transcriptional regulator, organic hydroperoxide resistance regulator